MAIIEESTIKEMAVVQELFDVKGANSKDFRPGEVSIMVNHSPRDLIGEYGIFRRSAKYAIREPRSDTVTIEGSPSKVENLQPSDTWEKGSEILFGQVYQIKEISKDGAWMKIHVGGYGTEGWIELHQHAPSSREQFEFFSNNSHPMLASFKGKLESLSAGEREVPLFVGASLPTLNRQGILEIGGEQFRVVEGTPVGGWLRPTVSNFLGIVKETEGLPYEWGGKGGAADCSGLTAVAFSFFGIKLPHSSGQQSKRGDPVSSVAESRTGDVIAYGKPEKPGTVNHIGLIVRDGEKVNLVHASQYARVNELDAEGLYNKTVNLAVRAIRRLVEFSS